MNLITKTKLAKEASIQMAVLTTEKKNKALLSIAESIKKNKDKILKENKKDVEESKKAKQKDALIKRLVLNDVKIEEIVNGLKDVVKLEDPVNKVLEKIELDTNLILSKVTSPIGVIGAIFESRPDAVPQISSLCLKSGNAVILKGGSEARHTNKILVEIITNAAESSGIPKNSVQLIETREQVKEMLKLDKYIDLLLPRGSSAFVKYIQDNTKIPVLGHADGICHLYIDKDADIEKAIRISIDGKCQYPAVCNAVETLLINKETANIFLPKIVGRFIDANVELRLDNGALKILYNIDKMLLKHRLIKKAIEKDWDAEYNDLILSVKIVKGTEEAIEHINAHGSHHTDGIVTENKTTAENFMNLVDSSSVMWNASTRFADGFRYGKGAEVGISTSKLHARGPVGLDGLVIYKYKLTGNGHIVKDYTGENAKKFKHKVIK